MSITIHNFMGRFGWEMQKRFPMLASNAYLKLQFKARAKSQKAYIDYFNGREEAPQPLIVNLETINRCNSDCEFCAASRKNETRPLKKMSDDKKEKLDQLAKDMAEYQIEKERKKSAPRKASTRKPRSSKKEPKLVRTDDEGRDCQEDSIRVQEVCETT